MLVAGHVVADEHLDRRRRRPAEVRKEARDLLQPVERRAGAFGELAEFRLGQVPVPVLNVVQFLNDHGPTVRLRGARLNSIRR